MPTAYTTLSLTDGTIAADLVDGTNYQLRDGSWAPAVASRKIARQAGQSPYEDVLEEITIFVRGSSGAVALSNLSKLTQLLDQADQFAAGDLVAPVLLKVQPQGSVLLALVSAVVLGRAPGSAGWMSMPVTFSDYLQQFEIGPVTLRFLRSGLWYGADDTATATAADNPTVQTATMATTLVVPGPTKVELTGFANDTAELAESYIFVASDSYGTATDIQIVEGETGSADASGVTITATADPTNKARAGEVGRVSTPSDTAFEGASYLLSAAIASKRAYLLMAVRNNTIGAVWHIYGATKGSSGQEGAPTGIIKIEGDSQLPQIVPLGICYNSENHAAVRLYFRCSNTSATLDIDYIAIMARDFQHSYVVHLKPKAGIAGFNEVVIDPAALTAMTPVVEAVDDTVLPADYPIGYDSDAWLATNTDEVKVAWFSTRGAHWRWTKTSGTVFAAGVTVTRKTGYLTPQ